LFSIGLVELELDGTVRLQGGQPIPTYDQEIIEGFAHVFTGWTYAGSPSFSSGVRDYVRPMIAFEAFHDTGEKRLLRGAILPAGRTAAEDLKDALDTIFSHPNVAPFISRQLIQRLVTSNPSPGYVRRVAQRFEDDGRGVRGNLGAVVRAILFDDEARRGHLDASLTFGKLKEPLLRLSAT
ncbi:MAG: DUF1800 family protein, partial [Xanthomonadales bacterium]|nr:DUF1800 family protein [Xanthomonadales bacterium]